MSLWQICREPAAGANAREEVPSPEIAGALQELTNGVDPQLSTPVQSSETVAWVETQSVSQAQWARFSSRILALSRSSGHLFTLTVTLDAEARKAYLVKHPHNASIDDFTIHVRHDQGAILDAFFQHVFGAL